jgi:hypothetical protein
MIPLSFSEFSVFIMFLHFLLLSLLSMLSPIWARPVNNASNVEKNKSIKTGMKRTARVPFFLNENTGNTNPENTTTINNALMLSLTEGDELDFIAFYEKSMNEK